MSDTSSNIDVLLITIIIPAILGIIAYIVQKTIDTYQEYKNIRAKKLNDQIKLYWQLHNFLKIHHDLTKRIDYLKNGKNYVSPSPDDENQFGIDIINPDHDISDHQDIKIHISTAVNSLRSVLPPDRLEDRLEDRQEDKKPSDQPKLSISDSSVQTVRTNISLPVKTSPKISKMSSYRNILNQTDPKYLVLIQSYELKKMEILSKIKTLIHDNIYSLEPDEQFGELLSIFNRYVYLQECIHDQNHMEANQDLSETIITYWSKFNQEFKAEFPQDLPEYIQNKLKVLYDKKLKRKNKH